jgi:hypothetical protein
MNNNEKKDTEYELSIEYGEAKGSIKLKNINNQVMAKIGDIIIDSLSFFKWSNAVYFLDKYNKKKEKRKLVGKETPLPPKFIIEILNNAFQEDDEEVQDEWNNLLVNWQDLERKCDKKYMYIEILKNLGLNEIRLLKLINEDPNFSSLWKDPSSYYSREIIQNALGLNNDEYELMMLNLFRLKVCDSLKSKGNMIELGNLPVRADAGIDKIKVTIIGFNLINSIKD